LESLISRKAVGDFISFIYDDGINEPVLKEELLNTLLSLEDASQKETVLSDNEKILPFISYFRRLAADEMKKDPNQFEAFFQANIEQDFSHTTSGKSYPNLISEYVLAMGADFSHPAITALCQKLQFPVRIIDPQYGAADGLDILDGKSPQATFCRNGAHYFVLYPTPNPTPVAQPIINPIKETPKLNEITVKCQVPFGHDLFIRGSGNGLNWERGMPLIQVDEDTWVLRSTTTLNDMEYKFLINDSVWDDDKNQKISQGKLDGQNQNPQFDLSKLENTPMPPVKATRITVQYPAALEQKLFIRGSGPGMSWDRGVELRHVGSDIWVFETQANASLEYKIVLNNTQ
jgi:hypothetical protein